MNDRLQSIRNAAARLKARLPGFSRRSQGDALGDEFGGEGAGAGGLGAPLKRAGAGLVRCLPWLAGLTAVAGAVALLVTHPPFTRCRAAPSACAPTC
ncbi:hypothetical protein ACQ859_00695 [Roseateles chitinivorans]|uniref:hypothetical protein n=1 Tax=Roseateles chitinivorans TaxID=2917965 RepID=UPI003D67C8A5